MCVCFPENGGYGDRFTDDTQVEGSDLVALKGMAGAGAHHSDGLSTLDPNRMRCRRLGDVDGGIGRGRLCDAKEISECWDEFAGRFAREHFHLSNGTRVDMNVEAIQLWSRNLSVFPRV